MQGIQHPGAKGYGSHEKGFTRVKAQGSVAVGGRRLTPTVETVERLRTNVRR